MTVASVVAATCLSAPALASEGFGAFARSIGAGKLDEQCFRLDQGERARWRFDTTAPVDFNLHWHRGNDVRYPVRRNGVRRDAGQFVAPHGDDYCLMWENKGKVAVELKGEVFKGEVAKGDGAKGETGETGAAKAATKGAAR